MKLVDRIRSGGKGTAVSSLHIYRNLPAGAVHALDIILDDKGKVTFIPGEQLAADAMRMLGSGAAVWPNPNLVTPDQGEDYFRAVYGMLQRSTGWTAVAEPAKR